MDEEKITLNSIKSPRNKKIFFVTLVFLIAIPVAVALVAQFQNNSKNPQVLAANEVQDIIGKVGKIVDLPKNETPTIATVSDVTKLNGQEFFAKAQNGDKVIIYAKAQKAYLYRPGTDKLIEVAFYNPPQVSPLPTRGIVPVSQAPTPTIVSLRDMLKTSPTPTQQGATISPAVTSVPTPTVGR
jgi:hypothetical protein